MPTHILTRYESPQAVATLEHHLQTCDECSKVTRASRTACKTGQKLHEMTVQGALANKANQGVRGTRPWHEKLDLADLSNPKLFADYMGSVKEANKQSAFSKLLRVTATIEAVDTSVWQGYFPGGEIVAQGCGLWIPKASEGNGYTDPQWGNSISQILSGGLAVVGGSYHFARPDLGSSGTAEGDWYLGRHPSQCFSPSFPWVFSLDAESAGGSAGWCYEFLNFVSSKIGYSCWFYSFSSWISSRGVQAYGNPLWIAWPNPSDPPNMGWPVITMNQYGTRGFSIGAVDADTFQGSHDALLRLAGVGTAPAPPPPPPVAQGASSDMSIAVANHPNGTRMDWVCIAPGGQVYHKYGDPAWDVSKHSSWEMISADTDARAVTIGWVYPANPGLVITRLASSGLLYLITWSPQNGWSSWVADPSGGVLAVPAWKGEVGVKGDPGAAGPAGPAGPAGSATYIAHNHKTDGGVPTG